MTSRTKNLQPPTKENVFHCRLEDLSNLLRVWTALTQSVKELWRW